MKYSYLEFKNKYTKDQKYLAVINENGLWIKDNLDGKSMIIHSEKIEKNILKNIIVTIFDDNFRSDKSIIAKEATITNKSWKFKRYNNFQIVTEKKILLTEHISTK